MNWISIKDKKPDSDRAVIGLCDDGHDNVYKVYYLKDHDIWCFYDNGDALYDITHWIEFPIIND